MSTEEKLLAIIDFCDAMATVIREDHTDPRGECRAIWDAHDLAHVITGGDKTRDWRALRGQLGEDDERAESMGDSWPDVVERMNEILAEQPHD